MTTNENLRPSIAVIGLGYVGLPLALSYTMKGCVVYGIDVNQNLVANLNKGYTQIHERDGQKTIQVILKEQVESGNFIAETNIHTIPDHVSTYIVTVGIPIVDTHPNYEHFDQVFQNLKKQLKPGDLLIIRSTVVPGTTEDRVVPMLMETGLQMDKDLFVAYCSERIAEGRAFEEHRTMPLVVGGIGPESVQRAVHILKMVTEAPIHLADIKVVETSKVIENIQRDVNIALAQEIAAFCQASDIDTMELIRTANTHKRVNLLTPGPGVGGYCIPNAFHYLHAAAKEVGVETPLLLQSRYVNERAPLRVIDRVRNALESQGKRLAGAKVAVLGLAMKDHSSDPRLSPSIEIANELQRLGAYVQAFDPYVSLSSPILNNDVDDCVRDADALLVLILQPCFLALNFSKLLSTMNRNAVVFDAKRIINPETCKSLQIPLLHM